MKMAVVGARRTGVNDVHLLHFLLPSAWLLRVLIVLYFFDFQQSMFGVKKNSKLKLEVPASKRHTLFIQNSVIGNLIFFP